MGALFYTPFNPGPKTWQVNPRIVIDLSHQIEAVSVAPLKNLIDLLRQSFVIVWTI
jgi:hypothetical protein